MMCKTRPTSQEQQHQQQHYQQLQQHQDFYLHPLRPGMPKEF